MKLLKNIRHIVAMLPSRHAKYYFSMARRSFFVLPSLGLAAPLPHDARLAWRHIGRQTLQAPNFKQENPILSL